MDFNKILNTIKNAFQKMTTVQKLVGVGVILAAIVIIAVVFSFNSGKAGVPLFTQRLDPTEFGAIIKKLDEENIKYAVSDDQIIILKDSGSRNRAIMSLTQSGLMPRGRYTFLDIINSKRMNTTTFMTNIQYRAAVAGQLEETLMASNDIEDAKVTFTVPEKQIYTSQIDPVRVAVVLTPSYGSRLTEDRRAIKGIEEMILNSIEGASAEYITITDNRGYKLNDWEGESEFNQIAVVEKNLRIRQQQIEYYKNELFKEVTKTYNPDRVSIVVDVQMNFDNITESRTEILPVILKLDDPATPYDDGERVYSIVESEKIVTEEFTGPGWIPEGPPGFDPNVPPGYRGALEQMSKYEKKENITNRVFGESKQEIVKDGWTIERITASVILDGIWEIEYDDNGNPVTRPDGSRQRKYANIDQRDLQNLRGFLERGIGFKLERGDLVEVYEVKKDRSTQFAAEDAAWKRQKQTTMAIVAALIAFLLLIVIVIIYRFVAKELERRRRLREEELARQHQLAREMALKSAEEDSVQVEMSIEDKARLEMQENAINMAREHPEDVAQLIRTWLQEE